MLMKFRLQVDMDLEDDCASPVSGSVEEGEKNPATVVVSESQMVCIDAEEDKTKKQVDEPHAPPPFIAIEENVILCDESLIKEAAVNCFLI